MGFFCADVIALIIYLAAKDVGASLIALMLMSINRQRCEIAS